MTKDPNRPQKKVATQTIEIPGADRKVKVEVDLIPAESATDMFDTISNVARVNIGGQEFYAVLGKTSTE